LPVYSLGYAVYCPFLQYKLRSKLIEFIKKMENNGNYSIARVIYALFYCFLNI